MSRRLIASLVILAAVAGAIWLGAPRIVDEIERRSQEAVLTQLRAEGHDWAQVTTDGLILRLTGTAPDEVSRFRAASAATTIVTPDRVEDAMQVATRPLLAPPDFELEILRNDSGISVIGLVPSSTDRAALSARLGAGGAPVTDLLSLASYPPPEGWDDALDFAIRATAMAPQVQISARPGAVRVTAGAASAEDKTRLESTLRRALPKGVTLTDDIRAPLPVVSPFTLRFVAGDERTGFDACLADTPEASAAILSAAQAAGMTGKGGCTLALGAPSANWGATASAAIAALGRMGAGEVTLTGPEITLRAAHQVDAALFARESDALAATLKPPFTLRALHDAPPPVDAGPPAFRAEITPRGARISGRVADERMREVIGSLARARLGPWQGEIIADPSLPEDWSPRVIAGLEALGLIDQGALDIDSDHIRIEGLTGDTQATDKVVAALSERLDPGAAYSLSIGYDRRLDPGLDLPTGDVCAERLNNAMASNVIGFEPGGATIVGDIGPLMRDLGTAMQDCEDYRIEIGGHTDAQGSDGGNLTLSQDRANAVLSAMNEAGIPARHLTSQGYGETRPIADNDTEEGRDANRRIEFMLLSDAPEPAQIIPDERQGLTAAPVPKPAIEKDTGPETAVPPAPIAPAPVTPATGGAVTLPPPPFHAPETVALPDPAQLASDLVDIQPADDSTPRPPARPSDFVAPKPEPVEPTPSQAAQKPQDTAPEAKPAPSTPDSAAEAAQDTTAAQEASAENAAASDPAPAQDADAPAAAAPGDAPAPDPAATERSQP